MNEEDLTGILEIEGLAGDSYDMNNIKHKINQLVRTVNHLTERMDKHDKEEILRNIRK